MHDGEKTALFPQSNDSSRGIKTKALNELLDLRDIGKGPSEVISNGVNVIPLLLGHGRTDIVGQHLGLIKQPLEDEERSCCKSSSLKFS